MNITKGCKVYSSIYLQKFNQKSLGRPESVGSEAVFKCIETNPLSDTQRVSGEFGTSETSVFRHIHILDKRLWSFILPKYC